MKSLWLGRLSIHVGMQEKGDNGFNPPWHGFSYGSWIPRFGNNGLLPLNKVVDLNGYWLCFHWSVTWWGNMERRHGMWGFK